jgi:hypothetical protein
MNVSGKDRGNQCERKMISNGETAKFPMLKSDAVPSPECAQTINLVFVLRSSPLIILFLSLFISSGLFSQKDPADTLLIKRQRFAGLFVGGLFFVPDPGYVTDHEPAPVVGLGPQLVRMSMDNSWQGGFFFTFPFLYKMDWDLNFMVQGFIRTRYFTNVTSISNNSPPVITSYSKTIDHDFFVVSAFQTHFVYELFTHDRNQMTIGAGGWIGSGKLTADYDPGAGGAELCLNFYQQFGSNNNNFRLSICPGAMRLGPYINASIGYCVKGYRTMHAHPKHYYVRTYDYDE